MALVLNRVPQQKIFISHPDGRIVVTVLDVSGPQVRLSFDAPRSVTIERDDMKRGPTETHHPCIKCGGASWTLDGLCFRCQKIENGD